MRFSQRRNRGVAEMARCRAGRQAEQQLRATMKECDSSLHERAIVALLRVDIENYCENLPSVLDYLAHGIGDNYCLAAYPKVRFYITILPDATHFASRAIGTVTHFFYQQVPPLA
jgi:hypothetical protein